MHAPLNDPAAPLDVPIDVLAERVIKIYWRQVEPLPDGGSLHQSSESAKILEAVSKLREAADAKQQRRCPSPRAASLRVHEKYLETVKEVRSVLLEQPLPKLQHLGSGPPTTDQSFLYDESKISHNSTSVSLKNGVAPGLAQLALLLKPAIQYLWVDMVWRKNDEQYKKVLNIKAHLFGRQRTPLGPVGRLLKKEFGSQCFYCNDPLQTGGQVDHVLPWSIIPIDELRISLCRVQSATTASRTICRHSNTLTEH